MKVCKVKGKPLARPVRKACENILSMPEIITGVNAILNPGKDPIDWFAPAKDAVAAVHIKDGKYEKKLSNEKILFGGTVGNTEAKDIKVVAYNGNEGGIYAEGAATDITVDTAYISLEGEGCGIGGPASGAAAKYGASLTLKNVVINTTGRTKYATAAEENSVLKVYDSVIWSHGIPYGGGYEKPTALMSSPPDALEMDGNTRTHCTMSNSYSYFYNSKIICDGWAALSTESSDGYVYLEANDCDIVCTKNGYGAYADPGCHDIFRNCNFDMAKMAAILARNATMEFADCNAECGTYFGLMHCVNGWCDEVGDMTISDGKIRSKEEVFLIKSHNAILDFCNVDMASEKGILVHTILNSDPCKTKGDEDAYGVNICLADMSVEGDLLHEDNERAMWVDMVSTTLKGGILNANLNIDAGSKWIANKDSKVHFLADINIAQIDAGEGVTIEATGAVSGTYTLASGGKLIVTER